ncbi:MAG: Rieske 2Fe-2S domain-containing protein [Cyanobacteria bacterium RI_101]|nr:Rieske 2Fe-2S domain-containing protein [Cyanobacteria bacterium RI_101]
MTLSLPPGGADLTRFDSHRAWYPVFYLTDLTPGRLYRFTLLEIDLVIWWDAAGDQWRAHRDQCPHRLAPLSQGRVNEKGLLECPYHGWAFNGEGTCQEIPQQPSGGQGQTSQRACLEPFATASAQDLLFVFAGAADLAPQVPLPLVDVLEENPQDWVCLDIFRDLPYDALTLLENVLDSSHIPYTHHNTVGKRGNVSPVNLEILQSDRQGFRGMWAEGPRKGTLGRQDTTFIAPSLMWHDLTSKQFGRTLTVVYATPIRKGECRLFARFPFKFASAFPKFVIKLTPRWYSHLGQNRVLEDDQIFLHFQERYLAQRGGSEQYAKACYLPTKADLFVLEYRNWLNHYQGDPFPGQSFSAPLSAEVLLNRYHSHTQHCASCRGALKNLERLRFSLGILALSILTALPWSAGQSALTLGLTLLLVGAVLGWLGLGRLRRSFYQGPPVPPRNLS